MADFPIKIRTDLEGQGLKQTKEEFKLVEQEAKKADAAIAQTVSTQEAAGGKAEEVGGKQEAAAHKAALGHRELRESVSAVGRQFGGLADVGLWLNPITAALAATLAAVDALREVFANLQEPIDAANKALRALDDARIKAAAESASDFSKAIGEIATHENELEASYKRGTTAMENRIKLYNEEKDGVIKVAEAKEKAFEEELNLQTALHPELKEKNDAKKESARLQLEILKGTVDVEKRQHEINELATQFNNAQLRIKSGADKKAVETAEAGVAAPHEKVAKAEAEKKSVEEEGFDVQVTDNVGQKESRKYKTLDDLKKDAQEEHQTAQESAELGDQSGSDYFKQIADQLDAAVKSRETYIANLGKEIDIAKAQEAAAASKVKIAQEQLDSDEKLNVEGGARIALLQAELDIVKQVNAATATANASAAASRGGTEHIETVEKTFNELGQVESKLQGGHGTQEDWKQLQQLTQRLIHLVGAGQGLSAEMKSKIQHLETQIAHMEQWHAAQGGHF